MLIGLDGLPLTELKTGVGHYTFELARALARVEPLNRFQLLYPSTYPAVDVSPDSDYLPENLEFIRVSVGPVSRHWWSTGLPRHIKASGVNLFHGTNYDVPLWRRCATVLTIHDLSLLIHADTHEMRAVRRARRRLPIMARLADAIITPTQSVAGEVAEHLKVDRAKIFAVPEAARETFRSMHFAETRELRQRLKIGDDFLLSVGTIEPRKNLIVLIEAFEQVVAQQPGTKLQLVIAGGRGWLSRAFFDALEQSPARDRMILTDYLDDENLRALYSSCRAFIYPSLYEGFGLPPLEAMACGAPVIASRIKTLEETTGGAALLFDPHRQSELADAIIRVMSNENERIELARAGQQRAAEFSWERSARMTLDVYARALRNFKPDAPA
jgi:glycosyltransferase involved in cell wall biosynthesis